MYTKRGYYHDLLLQVYKMNYEIMNPTLFPTLFADI